MIIKIDKQFLDSGQVINFSIENIKDFVPISLDGSDVYIYTAYEPQDILYPYQIVSKNDVKGQFLTQIEIPTE